MKTPMEEENGVVNKEINHEAPLENHHLAVDDNKDAVNPSENTSISGGNDLADEKAEIAQPEVPPRDVHGFKWALVVIAILSSIFLFALDNTIVADIQPAIVEAFGDVGKLPWLSVAFLLAAASFNLIWGKVYGQFNSKWTYIFCVLVFEVGSAVCGAAPNMNALIVGRAICGLGGSGMYVGVMTLLSVTTTMQERPAYIGSTGLTWGVGTVLGPIVGGAFTISRVGWRWSFYINICIGAAFAPIYLFLLPTFDPRPTVRIMKRFKELDFVGGIILVGAFISATMAISFGGIIYSWSSGQTIALFVVCGILFIVFAIQQEFHLLTTVDRRIFPVEFLRSRSMIILFCETACAASAMVVPLYFIPLFFQFTRTDSALEAGVRLLPYICLMVFACIANGIILSIHGLYMPWYLVGGVFVTVGTALMHTVKTSASNSTVYGYTAIIGLGVGCFVQASFSVAQALVRPEQIPSAVGFITCGQITGITLAIAIANTVFINTAQAGIAKILPTTPQDQIQGAIAGVGSDLVNHLPSDQKAQVIDVIVDSIGKAYFVALAGGAFAIVLALGMKRQRLFMTAGAAA